jgi:hypothetical protein
MEDDCAVASLDDDRNDVSVVTSLTEVCERRFEKRSLDAEDGPREFSS